MKPGKSASVEQKPITSVGYVGGVLTTTQHHIPSVYCSKCGGMNIKDWELNAKREKARLNTMLDVDSGVLNTASYFENMPKPSQKGVKILKKQQLWQALSQTEKRQLTELNDIFNIRLIYALANS
jgi:hypothetical protein